MYGPYGLQESLYWLRKYFRGPTSGHGVNTPFPLPKTKLREIKPKFEIVFAGDLMSLGQCTWQLGPKLERWVSAADYLVVNLEAPITASKAYFHLRQFNELRVLETLTKHMAAERIFLSLANNHANDFGPEEVDRCVETVRAEGFNVFGTSTSPYAMIADRIMLYGATQWTNRSPEGLSWLDADIAPPQKPASPQPNTQPNTQPDLKLLFSHWGYEFELYPRPEQVTWAKNLLQDWDGIIGHHSHCPQPISFIGDGALSAAKPVVYSLGNFAIAYTKDVLNYGLTVKLSIGTPVEDTHGNSPLVIGALEWSFLSIHKKSPTVVSVELCDACPFF